MTVLDPPRPSRATVPPPGAPLAHRAPTIEPHDPKHRPPRRLLARIVRSAALHLLLIALAAIFVFPFFWMVAVSFKTDEESASGKAFPEVPTFRARSPFVRSNESLDPPAALAPQRWADLKPALLTHALSRIDTLQLPVETPAAETTALRQAAAVEALRKGIARLDDSQWTAPDAAILAAFDQQLTPSILDNALDDRLARIELRGLQVRSLDGHVANIDLDHPSSTGEPQTPWTIDSGPGKLIPIGPNRVCLSYHFHSGSDDPVVLHCDFDAGISPQELHRLILTMAADASWHRFDAELVMGGQRFVSEQPFYLAQFRAAGLLMQPPTFEDDTLGPRTWISMHPEGTVAGPPNHRATLRLTLRPSSTLRAIAGKAERNYLRAFRSVPFWTYVGNSVWIVLLQLVGTLLSTGFVGYAFARLNWPGRGVALACLLATMMLPAQVTMIPTFLIWRGLGWYNTLIPLWIGAWFGNAFFVFLMIQTMKSIPKELDEAGKIDGMNSLRIWWHIIMPQVKPTLAAVAIMTFIGAWNEFMGPLILLRDQTKFPLSLGLFGMQIDQQQDWTMIMACNMLMVLPVIAIFFMFQRYFVEGVTVTGMKG